MAKQKHVSKKKKKQISDATGSEKLPDSLPGCFARAWTFLETIAASRRTFWFCALVLPLAVLAYYPSYRALTGDYDIWFHLAYGKHYVENFTWRIDHSMYSWTPATNPSSYVTWMGSSALYLMHLFFGVPGLFALRLAVFLASAAVVFWLARAANIRAGLGLLAGLLLAAVTMRFVGQYIKPEMFSIFLVTMTVAAYLRFRMAPGPWIIAAFPVLFLVWVNTHGLWQFGLVFLGLVFAVDLVLYIFRRDQAIDRNGLIYMAWSAALTFLALCVNPFGASIPISFLKNRTLQVFNIFFAPSGGSGAGSPLDYYRAVTEYQSLWEYLFSFKQEHFFTLSAICVVVMIIVFLAAWIGSWRRSGKADLPVAAANIAFFFMCMFMARLVLVFVLTWIVSMVFLAWRAGPKPMFPRIGPLSLAVFVGLTGYIAATYACIYEDRSLFGSGYHDYIPDKEVRYIMDNDLPGPLFNDYLSGSYLMWAIYPDYKVFIDTRQFPYRGQVFPDYTGIGKNFPLDGGGLEAFTRRYPFRFALIHYSYHNIITWFHKSPDWTLVYFDATAVVMVHRDMLADLTPEAKAAMHLPSHYRDVGNPIVLSNLFAVYQNFLGNHYAAQIRDLFDRNVSDLYWGKKSILAEMNRTLEKGQEADF
jgi:hypothetical protein